MRHGLGHRQPARPPRMIPVNGPGEDNAGAARARRRRHNRIARAELISVVTGELDLLVSEVGRALEAMGFTGGPGGRAVGRW